jgi:hypothetical protein
VEARQKVDRGVGTIERAQKLKNAKILQGAARRSMLRHHRPTRRPQADNANVQLRFHYQLQTVQFRLHVHFPHLNLHRVPHSLIVFVPTVLPRQPMQI